MVESHANDSKIMATLAMFSGIGGFMTSLNYMISIPLCVVALVLGIVALAKHKPGKQMSIAGVIIGGLTLLILVFIINANVEIKNHASQSATVITEHFIVSS